MNEAGTLAKKQRTIQLPEEVFRLADAIEARTGARFNRQMLAALLQYYFTSADGPDPLWMKHAVAIEKGDASVGDMPERRVTDFAHRLRFEADSSNRGKMVESYGGVVDSDPIHYRTNVKHEQNQFMELAKRGETEPIDNITNRWAERERAYQELVERHRIGTDE